MNCVSVVVIVILKLLVRNERATQTTITLMNTVCLGDTFLVRGLTDASVNSSNEKEDEVSHNE
jgi:hypothetical protein